jgi:hypothetical protein
MKSQVRCPTNENPEGVETGEWSVCSVVCVRAYTPPTVLGALMVRRMRIFASVAFAALAALLFTVMLEHSVANAQGEPQRPRVSAETRLGTLVADQGRSEFSAARAVNADAREQLFLDFLKWNQTRIAGQILRPARTGKLK